MRRRPAALMSQGGVEAQPAVSAMPGIDDDLAQRAMCDVTFEVAPESSRLGAVSAVLLPKTP